MSAPLQRPSLLTRRQLLLGTAMAAAGHLLFRAGIANAAAAAGAPVDSSAARPTEIPEGKPGDFKFLEGEWRIAHRWRASAEAKEWLSFDGEATCCSVMGGVGSVEDLRIPARKFNGMGLRLLDLERKVWSDYWVNAKSGVLGVPGTEGGFRDGVGTFTSEDKDGDRTVLARGMWDRITGHSHRWSQAVSYDGGATWLDTWLMDWKKV